MSKIETLPDLSHRTLFDLKGKVIVVTGGGTGLGFMMSTAYVQSGCERIYICSRKMKNLEKAANSLNSIKAGVCIPLEADLTDAKGCKQLGEEIAKREKKIHVLVNNSGVSWAAPIDKFDEEKGWDRLLAVNVKSLFYLTVALLPLLKKDANIDNPASVINISSIYASLPLPNMPSAPIGTGGWSYLASKAAVSHLTRTMAANLKPSHVNVNAIAPGYFPSNMTSFAEGNILDRSQPAGRQGTPADMAGPALLLAGRGGAHLSGVVLGTDGGILSQNFKALPNNISSRWLPEGWRTAEDVRSGKSKL
ncbi:hypothetical protein L7F22_039246 [Adiantum nelumboides]|nr:hypothetical protein [Adiantum nelumboides]